MPTVRKRRKWGAYKSTPQHAAKVKREREARARRKYRDQHGGVLPSHQKTLIDRLVRLEDVDARLQDEHPGIGYNPHKGQRKFHQSLQTERWLFGGNRCLGGETLVYDPVLAVERRVDEIGSAFHVLAWNGQGLVVAGAHKPFTKGVGDLYEVGLSTGEKFTCAMSHLLLTPQGFRALSDIPQGGVVFHPQTSPSRTGTGSALCPSGVGASGARFWQTLPNSQDWKRSGVKWDFEVPGHHNYFAQGAIHHNSGKSRAGAQEAFWFATGTHPYRKIKTPNSGWVVSLDGNQQREAAQQTLLEIIPESYIKRKAWLRADVLDFLELWNGSKIVFRVCESGRTKFQGAAKTWIWFDEEPPAEIYDECCIRIPKGEVLNIWGTMTPLKGFSWIWQHVIENPPKNVEDFFMSIYDNPWLLESEIDRVEARFHGVLAKARLLGEFVPMSGRPVWGLDMLMALREKNREPLAVGTVAKSLATGPFHAHGGETNCKIFEWPRKGEQYALGADVAEGLAHGDFSTISIRNRTTLAPCLEVRCHYTPSEFAFAIFQIAGWYSRGGTRRKGEPVISADDLDGIAVGVERNNHGLAVLQKLMELIEEYDRNDLVIYKELVHDHDTLKVRHRFGWLTTSKTRPMMIDHYGEALALGLLPVASRQLSNEQLGFKIDDNGVASAQSGSWDDLVFADMIAYQMHRLTPFVPGPAEHGRERSEDSRRMKRDIEKMKQRRDTAPVHPVLGDTY